MTAAAPSPVPIPERIRIHPGPALLAGVADGPTLDAHQAHYGHAPEVGLSALVDQVKRVGLRGRGGAAFPFATKLETAARGRRPVVVVNLSEGEPASAKDTALALRRPHLILDGAVATARALGSRDVHVVLPGDRSAPRERMLQAMHERHDEVRLVEHTAEARFIAGQSRAVIELMSGRANLPVTSWAPEAVDGYRRRPTLLSNAETWAQVGQLLHVGETEYRSLGTAAEPGTALLTFSRTGFVPEVREVPFGTRMGDVLPPFAHEATALLGGFHGAWTSWETLADTRVSVGGAGIVHVLDPHACPLAFTSAVVDYLAGQSAGKCGPCLNGLPALSETIQRALHGHDVAARIDQLAQLLHRRGACAHPDGTVRMVRSMFTALPDEIAAHRRGACSAGFGHGQAVAS